MLYVVSTPIGNREDITLRALRILKEADIVLCEDTRHTGMLLKYYEISAKLMSFHSYSTPARLAEISQLLSEGKNIALVSDAGAPCISDPGYLVVQEAIKLGVQVSPIPGASACINALVCSGMPVHHFLYLGFLPLKKGRQTLFLSLQEKEYPVVIYESVHRIHKTLDDIKKYFGGEHKIVIAREMTKQYEEFIRGSVDECKTLLTEQKTKGEFCVIF